MLINFGDNRNGNGAEEPANQEGSLASSEIYIPEELKPQNQLLKSGGNAKSCRKTRRKISYWKIRKSNYC